ncbi:MAG: cobalamin B12-binding domain-containing protein [Coriobacteriia bacterium]|nr:cobalamin B12-binding domain-containing protein [Coriobacteriia bacterium]
MTDDAALRLYRALVRHDPAAAISVVERVRADGVQQAALFDSLFTPAMAILGGSWADGSINEYTFTQASVVADQIMSFVTPPRSAGDTGIAVLIGSMHRDLHDIDKNIVAATLREAGHRVVDLGSDVRPADFLHRAEETGARIVIVCAQMVSTARAVLRVQEMFLSAGRNDLVLLVSGGPFVADERLAREVRADGVVRGAESAMRLVARAALERLAEGRP